MSRLVVCDLCERLSHHGLCTFHSSETLRRGDAFTEASFDEGLDGERAMIDGATARGRSGEAPRRARRSSVVGGDREAPLRVVDLVERGLVRAAKERRRRSEREQFEREQFEREAREGGDAGVFEARVVRRASNRPIVKAR